MNWQVFSSIGYLGIILGIAAILSWLVYWKAKARIIGNIGFGLAAASLICATVNSKTHVVRITVDPAAQLAEQEARKKQRRQAALDSRGDEVAQIRFAEDGEDEFFDKAGMDEDDLKYLRRSTGDEEPEWRKEKKTRGSSPADDDDLESLIDDEKTEGGVNVEEIEAETPVEPILMPESAVVQANKLDHWNLRTSQWLVAFGVFVLGFDYLRRFNSYHDASPPLPLPSRLPNAITPLPAVTKIPKKPRRRLEDELRWLACRGDSFIYLTDQPVKVESVLTALAGSKARFRRIELLDVDATTNPLDDDFVFENLWYGKGSFAAGSRNRAHQILQRFTELLAERRVTRASTAQNVHVVWDLDEPIPDETKEAFINLANPAGFSVLLT